MAHTLDAVVHDGNGVLWMVVIPDDDAQLDDPAFNPAGGVPLRVPHTPGLDPIATAASLHPALNLRLAPAAPSEPEASA